MPPNRPAIKFFLFPTKPAALLGALSFAKEQEQRGGLWKRERENTAAERRRLKPVRYSLGAFLSHRVAPGTVPLPLRGTILSVFSGHSGLLFREQTATTAPMSGSGRRRCLSRYPSGEPGTMVLSPCAFSLSLTDQTPIARKGNGRIPIAARGDGCIPGAGGHRSIPAPGRAPKKVR